MRWREMRPSRNVEDRRRAGPGRGLLVGGGFGGVVIAVIVLLMGGDPRALLSLVGGAAPGGGAPLGGDPTGVTATGDARDDELARMVAAVLGSTEEVWAELFRQRGQRYVEPTLVLFRSRVQSACGLAGAASGPFYCPADSRLYIDLSFYEELARRFGAPGDFAQAYVIAHEVGHHVQNLLGLTERVHRLRGRVSDAEYNDQSVRLELQADFLAGVWAHHAQKRQRILDPGDLEEALQAATAIGDDRIQMQSQGYVVPDSFTHGTGAQRVRWFRKGFESGRIEDGDTFSARDL